MSDSKVADPKMDSIPVETEKSQTQSKEIVDGKDGALENEPTNKSVDGQAAPQNSGNGQLRVEVKELRDRQHDDATELHGKINAVSEKQHADSAELHTEMQTGFGRLQAENRELRGETQTGMAELRGEMYTGFAELRGEMQTGFAELRGENEKLRGEMHTGMAELRVENEKLRAENAETRAMIKSAQLSLTRWIIATSISLGGLMMTLIGLLIATEFFG